MSGALGEPIAVWSFALYGSLTYVVSSMSVSLDSLNLSTAACWTPLMPSFCSVHSCRPSEPPPPEAPGPELPQAAVALSARATTPAAVTLRVVDHFDMDSPLSRG